MQCDEVYPCSNCTKHEIPCSYARPQGSAASHTQPKSSRTLIGSSPNPTSGVQDWRLFREQIQRQHATQSETEQLNAQFFSVLTNSIQGSSSLLDKADWAKDLELMHHFCAITANTLATREDLRYTWRVTVPREGYSNPFLMHGILSMAALHRAYLYPAKAEEYLRLSAYHQSSGLKDFQKLLLNIQQDNWKAVFCFASMVVIYVSALPTRLGTPILPTPISNITNLLLVTKGMDSFLRPFLTVLRNSNLAAFAFVNMVEIPLDERSFAPLLLRLSLSLPKCYLLKNPKKKKK